ncbi:12-oxophytodienoate reductase [Sphingomonas histidinilytica]|nr:12-oxophytodienoate reductase [Rhizorhabdus histidinilytica]
MSLSGSPSPLFRPLPLGGLSLRNRIAMAPMTRERAPGGMPTDAMAAYYARRAAGGTGLIVTEGIATDATGCFGDQVPRLFGPDVVDGWRKVVDGVHAEGAAIIAQLWHVGAFAPSMIGMTDGARPVERISPSGLAAPGRPFGRTMTESDIADSIAAFAGAAAAAQGAGFDGIELHGAHGYLIDQFLWPQTNRRTDRFGPADRTRFAVELVRAVRRATRDRFALSFRLSQWKQLDYGARLAETPGELAAIVGPLAEAGVDLFHCSTRRFWEPAFPGDDRNLAGWTRALSGKPAMTVGSITLDVDFKAPDGKVHASGVGAHVALLERGLELGWFDLVAVGRAMIANPDWARRVRDGDAGDLRPFTGAMLETLI